MSNMLKKRKKTKKKKTLDKSLFMFLLPEFIGVLVFVILPLIDVIIKSFQLGRTGVYSGSANYKILMDNDAFKLAMGNTLKFELVSIPLVVILSLLVAVVVTKNNCNWMKLFLLMPLLVPSNAMGIVIKVLFDDQGIVNNFIVNVAGGQAVDFYSDKNIFYLLVGVFLIKNIGYNMLIWIAGLALIPSEIYDAAKVDGANDICILFRITIPNIRRTAYIVTILSLVNSFKIFRESYMIAGSYPAVTIYQLQNIFNNWFDKLEIGKMAAGAVVTLIFFGLLLLMFRFIILDLAALAEKAKTASRRKRYRRADKRKGDK